MQLQTEVAPFGANDGQSYALSITMMFRAIRGGFIFMRSRGVRGSHALHGAHAL